MIPFDQIDMAEATRLTREGRLEEAMALLRGGRPGPAADATDDSTDAGAKLGTRRVRPASPVLDLVPPGPGTGAPGRRRAPTRAAGRLAACGRRTSARGPCPVP